MTFSNHGGPGQHFRGRYSPATSPTAASPQEPVAGENPQDSANPVEQLASEAQPQPEVQSASPKQRSSEVRPVLQAQPLQASGTPRQSGTLVAPLLFSSRNALIAGILAAGGAAILASSVSNRSAMQAPLSWQASCGSPHVSGSSWWPVLGPVDAVDTVRSRYCGDAYLTPEGASQVASFSSREEAAAFADRLSQESGYGFRVGQPRMP